MSDENQLEVIPPSALQAITSGEIDIQIATAHRYPRSLAVFKRRALEMVTMDEETAASCIYSRPVGKKKNEKGQWVEEYAEGLSVRTAEIVGASYGNLRVGAMVVEQTDRYVKARGFAHDLESNFASSSEVIESTVTKEGNPFSERMRVIIAKACVAKARRDATFQVVPRALCRSLEEAARQVAIGDATTLSKRRAAVMAWVNKLGIPVARVFNALGIQGEDEIGLDQLTILTGLKTSIKDGDVKIDEAFPDVREEIKMPQPKKKETPAAGQDGGTTSASSESGTPAAEAGKKKEAPPFVAETPADHIRLALADLSVSEPDFVEGLRAILADRVPKGAKLLLDLRDDVIAQITADGLDTILDLIEAKTKKPLRK